MAGCDQLLKEGQLKEVGCFTNSEGYAIVKSKSKDRVLEIGNNFFPFYIKRSMKWYVGKKPSKHFLLVRAWMHLVVMLGEAVHDCVAHELLLLEKAGQEESG